MLGNLLNWRKLSLILAVFLIIYHQNIDMANNTQRTCHPLSPHWYSEIHRSKYSASPLVQANCRRRQHVIHKHSNCTPNQAFLANLCQCPPECRVGWCCRCRDSSNSRNLMCSWTQCLPPLWSARHAVINIAIFLTSVPLIKMRQQFWRYDYFFKKSSII